MSKSVQSPCELKNKEERETWLRSYEDWMLYSEAKELGLKFYRYDLGEFSPDLSYDTARKGEPLTVIVVEFSLYQRDQVRMTCYIKKTVNVDSGLFSLSWAEGFNTCVTALTHLKKLSDESKKGKAS